MAKPGIGTKHGHQSAPETRERMSETDLSSDIMGRNALQGDDQANVHNQRQAVPDPRQEADEGPVESAKLLDKDERARRELMKGARSAEGNPRARGGGEHGGGQ